MTATEQIADLMRAQLSITPGWGADLAIPTLQEARRIVARLEAEVAWLLSQGEDVRDHECTIANLRGKVCVHEADDALARVRAFRRAWGLP